MACTWTTSVGEPAGHHHVKRLAEIINVTFTPGRGSA
jgi:hypothetical protein